MAFSEKLKDEIQNIMNGKNIYLNEPMKNHTSFKIGGPADILLIPKTYEEISRISKLCIKENIPYYVIGNGSNLLVKDGGIRGVVIKTTGLDKIEIKDDKVIAQSGALLSDVSKEAAENALTGLEFACGIPGSIGGAITMNAGAYNGEISFIADSCKVLDKTGNIIELNRDHLELGYRQSAIMKHGYIVLEVTFKLQKGDHNKIQSRIDDLTKRRTEKQPLEYPSAGSTFKRPEGHYASKLIQDSNLKGTHVGDAEVSQKHSGFIINKGNASAKDILDLIKIVQEIVYEKFQVQLEPEVRIIGEE